MSPKVQISMRIDGGLIKKVDEKRGGVDRGLVITKLLEAWIEGDVKLDPFGE